ncbi:NotI family restriction endonuclease [Erythrobacter sp. JK5]|uniref:NotI family restriction endonuclease n=1 Tax=Erythrobacter sp. JK5 TaxID=2829500 RepID=UPI0020132B1C|nr:NotI family restriction endonuclease [Erythrobacter sp. JK5]
MFGAATDDTSSKAEAFRHKKFCRFKDGPCTKVSKSDPIGVCSLQAFAEATIVCPTRFLEDGRVFRDAGRLAFGEGAQIIPFPEFKLLRVPGAGKNGSDKKIGKVDFLLGRLSDGEIVDFAALEIQAVYSSGGGVKEAFERFIGRSNAPLDGLGVDFRSSAQKRLVPQLQLKVPVFNRWGKHFFVAVDSTFYSALPQFRETSAGNSELTWLSYQFSQSGAGSEFRMSEPKTTFTEWEDVRHALKEGVPPSGPEEVQQELSLKLKGRSGSKLRILRV